METEPQKSEIKRRTNLFRPIIYGLSTLLILAIFVFGGIAYLFYHYGRDLPDHQQLALYEPPITTRVHANDGRLLAEYAKEKRIFVPLSAMPKQVVNAFLSAEDKSFYNHFGVDIVSVASAVITNIINLTGDKKLIGASTITQQVAKNFLLNNEASFSRKFKEAILAIRIEKTFTKDRILELYLNEIYLGFRSYGVAAAALNYFNKGLSELTLEEVAYLAALPKAPNNYHPIKNKQIAVSRRNWVIDQMIDNKFVSNDKGQQAKTYPLKTRTRDDETFVIAEHFGEEVRRWLIDKFGEKQLYEGGLSVRTTLDPSLQSIASKVLRKGLVQYDRRRGWRGPLGNLEIKTPLNSKFARFEKIFRPDEWKLAQVINLSDNLANVILKDQSKGFLTLEELSWGRNLDNTGSLGPKVKTPGDVLNLGDIIFVEPINGQDNQYHLRQPPEVEGAIVAIDPHNGRVVAMVGGFAYSQSQFNRVTQAFRQPGSAFKPFVYLAALENGLTPASIVLDAPVVIDQGPGLPKWKPRNYSNRFYGPSTLRLGLEKSQNLMTVRIAQYLGTSTLAKYAEKFGVNSNLPLLPSSALGSGSTTLINLTAAYAMLVNGGHKINPNMINKIQDRNGKTVYKSDSRNCKTCLLVTPDRPFPPKLIDERERVAGSLSAYQIVSMLEGVVLRGTGRVVSKVGRPLGGKTGTTNQFYDAWFIGFSPDLAVGVYVGYDTPRSLGFRESGGRVAAPIFRDFMSESLAGQPAIPFRIPEGIRFVRIDNFTGGVPGPDSKKVIIEAFKPGNGPLLANEIRGGQDTRKNFLNEVIPREALGGLY